MPILPSLDCVHNKNKDCKQNWTTRRIVAVRSQVLKGAWTQKRLQDDGFQARDRCVLCGQEGTELQSEAVRQMRLSVPHKVTLWLVNNRPGDASSCMLSTDVGLGIFFLAVGSQPTIATVESAAAAHATTPSLKASAVDTNAMA